MQKLQDYWNERSSQQRMLLVAAFAITFSIIAAFAWLANRPGMSLIYGGLDSAQAADVVAGIERAGVAYEVRGDAIWVDSSQRDRLRLDLAAQGLPATGSTGYELLDGMTGFGTTSQMFDAAYWRAKEGEIARTILALPNVKAARVHLAIETGRSLRREQSASASVTLTTAGEGITREQAAALRYLISSGVPGLQPDRVTVIDTQRGMIAATPDHSGADRAAEMKRNVERILEPHVGIGNAIVELNLDIVTETELLTEQRFDPEQRAVISQVTEETSDQTKSSGAGAVTAASNLPDTPETAGDQSESARAENRQQTNFEVSRMTREVSRQPGSIRRLTVAVLVNGVASTNAAGESVLVPRPEAELQVLEELVASAVGYDAARGDQITVRSLPFFALGQDGILARPELMDRLNIDSIIRLAMIGTFALAVFALVIRPMLRGPSNASTPGPMRLEDNTSPAPALEGRVEAEPTAPAMPAMVLPPPDLSQPETLSLPSGDPVSRLRSMMRERHEESVKILSGWIANKESAK